jgi:anti-sigma factor RsiW
VLDVGRDIERIRDYLAGRLSDQESEAFGERLVRDPQLVRELERTLKLSEGLRQLAHEGNPARALPRPRRRRVWMPGVLAVALWVHSAAERAPLLSASLATTLTREVASTVASQFTFVATRGSAAPALQLPREGLIELRAAAPLAPPGGAYRVTLAEQEPGDGSRVLGSTTVTAVQADGYLHVYADAARLKPGHFVLNVSAGSDAAPLEVYPFSLRAASATPP